MKFQKCEKAKTILLVSFLHSGSALRDDITKVVLSLQEDDTLLELKNKWWKTDQCSQDEGGKEDANELGLRNIGGIFLVLISGLVCGMLAAVGEFIWKSRQNAEIDRVSMRMEKAGCPIQDWKKCSPILRQKCEFFTHF